jgi:hypothetical protein
MVMEQLIEQVLKNKIKSVLADDDAYESDNSFKYLKEKDSVWHQMLERILYLTQKQ